MFVIDPILLQAANWQAVADAPTVVQSRRRGSIMEACDSVRV